MPARFLGHIRALAVELWANQVFTERLNWWERRSDKQLEGQKAGGADFCRAYCKYGFLFLPLLCYPVNIIATVLQLLT